MIKVENLSKQYAGVNVLTDINLAINAQEIVSILGPSGAGKSTLLRCLNLLEKPDAGIITINDTRLDASNYNYKTETLLRNQSSMVFQQYNLFKNKTVLENVILSLLLTKKIDKKQAINIGLSLLDKVGMLGHEHKYPATLSGGQQQRVAIARALAVQPKVLLFDEPTSALDPELVNEVLQVIKALAEEHTTMLIVTHEIDFAKDISDKIIIMENGQIIEYDTTTNIVKNPQQALTKRFMRKLTNYIEYEI